MALVRLVDDIRCEINWGSHFLYLDASTISFRHFVMFCSFLNFKNLWILNLSDSTEREFDSSHNFANSNIFQTRFSHFVFKMENPKFERKDCWSKYMSSFNQKSLCKFTLKCLSNPYFSHFKIKKLITFRIISCNEDEQLYTELIFSRVVVQKVMVVLEGGPYLPLLFGN